LANLEPLETWRSWAEDVRGQKLPCGHFIPEEASTEVVKAFQSFFKE
jgi:haloacetate dehalogenase